MSLTANAISTMFRMGGSVDNPSFNPTVQIINVKKIENKGGGGERWRIILSDGTHFLQGMCATQLNSLVHSGKISQHCIVRVNEFIINTMGSGQKICILLGAENVGPNPGDRIGAPVDVSKAGGVLSTPAGNGNSNPGGAQPMYGDVQSLGNPYGQRNSPGRGNQNPYSGGTNNNRFGGQSGGGSSSAPIVRTSASGQPITPISGLNMYSNRWVIRAKVVSKSSIRTWSNARGEGSLFSVELLDLSGTDVRCTFFKEAVDKFYPFLDEGRVYTFSGGRLKVANMQYNTCKSQFEITFDQNAEIHLDEHGGEAIRECYDFVKIAQVENVDPQAYIDILAVVKNVGEPTTIVSKKSGKELLKCELTVEDDSGADIRLTMWGDIAKNAPQQFANCPVVAFRRARVSDYGGRTLSGQGFAVNPDVPQAGQLRQWWSVHGSKSQSRSLSSSMGGARGPDPFDQRKTVSSIKGEQLGYGEKPDWLSFKTTITFLKKDKSGDVEGAWYTACADAGEPCRNMFKATQTSDGNWHCDKCQQTFDTCVRRFIFQGTVADDTCTSWVSFFNEQAEMIFDGAKADDLFEKLNGGEGKDLYDSTFMRATYTDWIIKCKVKQELVGDEQRIKTAVTSMTPVDYVVESAHLLKALCV